MPKILVLYICCGWNVEISTEFPLSYNIILAWEEIYTEIHALNIRNFQDYSVSVDKWNCQFWIFVVLYWRFMILRICLWKILLNYSIVNKFKKTVDRVFSVFQNSEV